MENVEKVIEFLDKAKVFYFLTTDGDQPKGRPFGFKILLIPETIQALLSMTESSILAAARSKMCSNS